MYVNGLFSGGNTGTENFTAYISPYLVVSKGGNYTKHIYIGSQRIVSKLGDLQSYGTDPRMVAYAGANMTATRVDYKVKYAALQQVIKDRYAKFEVPYYGKDNDDYVNGQGFCCNDAPGLRSFGSGQNDNPELFQYYYHSDHLGSTSLITDLDGEVVQHIEYVPFGEVFIEERNNTWNTPYLFNAKELDEETGLYYYGARYYDPRISLWYGCDLLQEKYPNYSTYAYTFQSPVKFIDPTGWGGKIALYGAGIHRDSEGKINERHEIQFQSEANRDVSLGDATVAQATHTSSSLIQSLIDITKEEGDIEYLSIYSHANTLGLILDNGQYGLEFIGKNPNAMTNSLGAAYAMADMADIYNNADIKFAENALVVFGGCNAGRTVSSTDNKTPIFSIAKDFAEKTGVATIGAYGLTAPNGKNRKADYEYRLFYKDKDGAVQYMSLGKELNSDVINKAKDFVNNLNKAEE